MFHKIFYSVEEFSLIIYKTIRSETDSLLGTQIYLIILLVIICFVSVVFLVYFLALEKKIDRKKEEILFLFLDIPRREVSDIFKKCVNFLNFCNVSISSYASI